ncbi:hypothetical protein [Carboxylicivirga sp. N1Y90]|uniref:hypothetical protein n=1 Tax=Carboxylicivirga fragile TaxID=3417571 RepID=UPI003D34AEE9|nr:hypothetical protein [Marinilabiliaceae bacterium N1Y90]
MNNKSIYLGGAKIQNSAKEVKGDFVEINNEKYYKISNYDSMDDFFMTIVSDSDHWMFLSSNGALTAGRKNRDNALFPYYTDDKIHDYCGITGSNTILLVEDTDKVFLWEPFSKNKTQVYDLTRNIYKSVYGNKIIFEETNRDLNCTFQYGWSYSEKFGFVKDSKLINHNDLEIKVDVLDGIQNILPNGVDYNFQNEYSNLLDAYKKNELLPASRLGLFMLSSIPVDRAEPSESLSCTTVWSKGLKGANVLLSNQQLSSFKAGSGVVTEVDVRAERGAYYINSKLQLASNESQEWVIVAEINQDGADVANLETFLESGKDAIDELKVDVDLGTKHLINIVSDADGIQLGEDELSCARHFSNCLYNVMRGGIYFDNYNITAKDFGLYVHQTNTLLEKQVESWLEKLPEQLSYQELIRLAEESKNADLIRISYEYLPLTFSRRHGDPSRPWNQFAIETKNDDGSDKLSYQGNWRDIFQNWEALNISFPEFTEGAISKFLNASTADGYNPYRITREGIDWESPDPDDPWAYIGYWGDHQIIYLQKFLEWSVAYHPQALNKLLSDDVFVYANVPYRIKSYDQILLDPQETIDFDFELNDKIKSRVSELGADARLLWKNESDLHRVNLTEKLLVTLLTKLSNFIPEAGIWLNTQRPEWNDANNALVGNGVSMVTLYYLRRFVKFWSSKLGSIALENVEISQEVKTLFEGVYKAFTDHQSFLNLGFLDGDRKQLTDALGQAGSDYRSTIYTSSFSGLKEEMSISSIREFLDLSLKFIDQSISANKTEHGLYHAYNLISFNEREASIRHLYEMLEGQVAVLSSGYLNGEQSLEVLDALKASQLFRSDQYSYILYPDRQLPRFTDKNIVMPSIVEGSKLLQQLVDNGNTKLIKKDHKGNYHFNSNIRNANELNKAIDVLDKVEYGKLSKDERAYILSMYEALFDHQSFTGRSGTFYGYEGLGSIYWHMVSKLLLAVQETYYQAKEDGADAVLLGQLKDHYFEIKAGIGLNKSPELYGAFPTDAYSHTPGNAGVKQPGMTGQVKEDVISRFGELGIQISDGQIHFNTSLINKDEVLKAPADFIYNNINGERHAIRLEAGQLAYTFCKVPVVYTLGEPKQITIEFFNGDSVKILSNAIDPTYSSSIFNRDGQVKLIQVTVKQ